MLVVTLVAAVFVIAGLMVVSWTLRKKLGVVSIDFVWALLVSSIRSQD